MERTPNSRQMAENLRTVVESGTDDDVRAVIEEIRTLSHEERIKMHTVVEIVEEQMIKSFAFGEAETQNTAWHKLFGFLTFGFDSPYRVLADIAADKLAGSDEKHRSMLNQLSALKRALRD